MIEILYKLIASSPIGNAQDLGLPNVSTDPSNLQRLLDAVFYAIAGVAIYMLIWGGLRYITAAGNPDSIKKARETLVYAVVGVVVAIAGYALVQFVIGKFQ